MNGLYRWAEDMLSENKNLKQKLKAELKEKRELEQHISELKKRITSLETWIEQEGEHNNTCIKNILKKKCTYCKCGYYKNGG